MQSHGLNIRGLGSLSWGILAMLSGIILVAYQYLKKVTTLNRGTEFYEMVVAAGFDKKLAKFITAQAAHETGGFTSSIYRNNNNAFGMKYAGQGSAPGEKRGHAYYLTIQQSIYDYKRWYDRRKTWFHYVPALASINTFVNWLKTNRYFEASLVSYQRGVEYYYNQIFV